MNSFNYNNMQALRDNCNTVVCLPNRSLKLTANINGEEVFGQTRMKLEDKSDLKRRGKSTTTVVQNIGRGVASNR